MTNTVVKTANYALDPSFVYMNNVGVVLMKVGMPNDAFNRFHAMVSGLIQGARISILGATARNIEFNTAILSWVDVEYLCIPVDLEEPPRQDIFEQFDMFASRSLVEPTQPFVISELDLEEGALTEKIMFRSTNNALKSGECLEYYPDNGVTFSGIQAIHDLTDENFIRVISLYTSEETPVVTSYRDVASVKLTQAPIVQFSPYPTKDGSAPSYVLGNSGAALIDEINAIDLSMDVVPFETIRMLLSMDKLDQYRCIRVLNEWKKLYGDLTPGIITSVLTSKMLYMPIVYLLETGYYPTPETLNANFAYIVNNNPS